MLSAIKDSRNASDATNVLLLVLLVTLGTFQTLLLSVVLAPMVVPVLGGLDFSRYFTALSATGNPATMHDVVLGWGILFTLALNFLIIAFVLFIAARLIIKVRSDRRSAEQRLVSFYQALQGNQKNLGKDFEQAIFDDVWDLYAR
jgi:large conductance mechanosensitive channel